MRVVGGRLVLRANAVPLIVSYAIHLGLRRSGNSLGRKIVASESICRSCDHSGGDRY
jgi:hypothetical protein